MPVDEEIQELTSMPEIRSRSRPSPFARLSDEIFLMVLRQTILPSWATKYTIPSSLAPFPQSALSVDLHMKLVITQVSKVWNRIGVELLYESVSIRRLGQLKSLIWALQAREGLSPLVRSLDINCLVPRGFCELHRSEVKRLFELCPRLNHFGFCPANDPLGRLQPSETQRLLPGSQSITSLVFNGEVDYSLIILPALVQVCRNLRSLSLVLPDRKTANHPLLHFDNLQSLYLRINEGSDFLPSTWLVPRLQRVSLHGEGGFLPAAMTLTPHRGTIRSLSLFDFMAKDGEIHLLGQLINSFPALKHLAVDNFLLRKGTFQLGHQTLTSLDLFIYLDARRMPTAQELQELHRVFPALQTVRPLEQSMKALRDIPASFQGGREFEKPWEACPHHGQSGLDHDSDGSEVAWIAALSSINREFMDGEGDEDYVECNGSVDGSDSDSDSDVSSCITVDEDEAHDEAAQEGEWQYTGSLKDHYRIFGHPNNL
ncbi:hypothetical protein B0H11DRAFT_2323248 [Mycena galericulata]|nr:hypothetical protein B0H11DRAFT_2323248 [Mycena galericulata]